MTDPISLLRVKTAHPKIRKELTDSLNFINLKLLGKGVRLRLAYVTRTIAEQNALHALGRTAVNPDGQSKKQPMGNIVTNAKGWESVHNYSLAFDIVLLIDANLDGIFEQASWDTLKDFDHDGVADWMEVVAYFKSLGWEWGGDWKSFKDKPHFQKDFGLSVYDMKKRIDKGQYTEEVIDGIRYKYITL